MSAITVYDFPDICKTIYEEKKSVYNMSLRYIDELRATSCISNSMYATKLEERNNMLHPQRLRELERGFIEFKDYMRKNAKKQPIPFTIKYRQKDFIRYNDKIRDHLIRGESLDKVRDLLGIRIILTSQPVDTIESVNQCYQILDDVINFFVIEKKGILLEGIAKPDSKFNTLEHPNIIIPKDNLISEELEKNVKNYILYPKGKGGYQSLHIVIRMKNSITVEFQIRTCAMDITAEEGSASHIIYAEDRHKESDICLDYSKVCIPGFSLLPNGKIYDTSGLVKSFNPFNFF